MANDLSHQLESTRSDMPENDSPAEPTAPGNMPQDGASALPPGLGNVRDPIGQVLGGRFEIQEQIGHGAFAVTYRGRDLRLARSVAIKVLRAPHATDPTFVQRSEREARAAASVSHGNVVDVYDFGQHGDLLYLVMQYIEGEDLKHLITREGPLPPRRAVEISLQILAGLAAIHAAGIIHRDIKPENVMIGRDGIARVTDFGIARGAEDIGLTTAGTTVGTASYMAPEQAQAGTLMEATDLYSVGVVLYEMLTARLPFEASTIFALLLAHIQTPTVPLSVRAPSLHIPPALDAVVMRALAKRPEDRFADAPVMANALSAAEGSIPAEEQTTRQIPRIDPDMVMTTAQPSWPAASMVRSPPSEPIATSQRPLVTSRRPARRGDRILPLALVLLLLLGGGLGGAALLRSLGDGDDTPEDDRRAIIAEFDLTPTATLVPTDTPEPAPTATLVPTDTPEPEPTETPVPAPTETPEPAPTATLVPTETPEPSPTETLEPRTMTRDFAASDWQGAYFQETGNMRPWSAVYAQSTGYGEGTLSFTVDGEPTSETFNLTVDGMTSENWTELPISILINGQQVYSGNSPFPTWNGIEGEQAWATVRVELPTSVLQTGENSVTFVNMTEEGEFSRPPYILLAAGTVTIEIR